MSSELSRISSGIAGLDELLHGGFVPTRAYMIRGKSGTGKTIFGYHFLAVGLAAKENGLFVSFEESAADLRANAETLGFDLSEVPILDLSPSAGDFLEDDTYTVFNPSEVEGQSTASKLAAALADHDPDRVVIDPLTQLRYLSPDDYQFHQTAASLMSYLKQEDVTTLFTSQPAGDRSDESLQYLCDGSITLTRSADRRSLHIEKFRGSNFRGGSHTMRIDGDRGVSIFPKLIPEAHHRSFDFEPMPSNVDALDALLGGGIERGSVTLISGPSGVGKSTTATTFARAVASRGERAALYLFEESEQSFTHRSEALDIPVDEMIASGNLLLDAVEPLALSADEFANRVRTEVEANDTQFVLIDGTAGYQISLQDEGDGLRGELHALARYLRNMGVTVVITDEIQHVTGGFQASDSHVSYLADNILFFRYIEVRGEIQKAIGVLKKRFGSFEPTLRSFHVDSDGIHIGEPLTNLRGVLTGTPEWGGEG